jgi:hypothetical protein
MKMGRIEEEGNPAYMDESILSLRMGATILWYSTSVQTPDRFVS